MVLDLGDEGFSFGKRKGGTENIFQNINKETVVIEENNNDDFIVSVGENGDYGTIQEAINDVEQTIASPDVRGGARIIVQKGLYEGVVCAMMPIKIVGSIHI